MTQLAWVYSERGKYDEAANLLVEAIAHCRQLFGERHALTQLLIRAIASVYDDWAKPEKAAEWRAKLDDPPAADIDEWW